MRKKNYKYLDPLFIRFAGGKLFEKRSGKKDAQENQLCELKDGHITPEIYRKISHYDSHINKIYLKTTQTIEPMIKEANSMAVEYNLLLNYKEPVMIGSSEESRRQNALAAVKAAGMSERRTEILIRLAEIKAELDMVDEMLLHYVERAEGILNSRISKYWRGILSVSSEKLEHFPVIVHKGSSGKTAYLENRKKLINMIEEIINYEGDTYDEEKYEK